MVFPEVPMQFLQPKRENHPIGRRVSKARYVEKWKKINIMTIVYESCNRDEAWHKRKIGSARKTL